MNSSAFACVMYPVFLFQKEIISGNYLKGLLDILQFQGFYSNVWTPDLILGIMKYLAGYNDLSIGSLQVR
ncbi:hypothetical protein XENTR_v10024024 [Xenopus tropicalis]|nr:hypothetical protein XENTR_v10024024 [Xenopus tropicalis]